MRLHRFFVPTDIKLEHDFWIHDERLLNQWQKVLRFRPGQRVVLFDGVAHDRLYNLLEMTGKEAHLELVTDFERKLPVREVYLFWSLLKKDKNDWILQKCTELGVSHFVPLMTERSEKENLRLERAEKIIVEASEQCGRSDIPNIRQPMLLTTALQEFKDKLPLFVCEQSEQSHFLSSNFHLLDALGVLVGPEGGWSDAEKKLFSDSNIKHLKLHDFTLRAETACVSAAAKLLQ